LENLSINQQEQQRVAVAPGNAQFMSIRQVSLRRAAAAAAGLMLLLYGKVLIKKLLVRAWSKKICYDSLMQNIVINKLCAKKIHHESRSVDKRQILRE